MDQYLLMRALTGDVPPFSGIVLMGMGEPLLNWDATRGFLIALKELCNVGARRITVSTVGFPEKIELLADHGLVGFAALHPPYLACFPKKRGVWRMGVKPYL